MIIDIKYHDDGSVSYRGHDRVRVRTFEPCRTDLMMMAEEDRSKVVHHVTDRKVNRFEEIEADE
jgi:hypothetical protein